MVRCCVFLAFSTQLFGFEFFKTQDGTPCKWDLSTLAGKTIPWKVAEGAPDIARESMLAATDAWSDASAGVLQFSEGDGGIVVQWGDANAEISQTALAQTSLSLSGNTITGARIIVNTALYNWVRGDQEAPKNTILRPYNLDPVLLHETGHALGLDHSDKNTPSADHSDVPTMNSVIYKCCGSLHIDDISGIRALYGIDAPLPQLTLQASPAQGRPPFIAAIFQNGGNDETRWDFGDGTAIIGDSASHRYRAPGQYTVTASVNGMQASVTIDVTRKGRKIRAPQVRK